MTTLPDSLTSALPSRERRSPGLELEDGRWMVAAKSGLYVFGSEASSGDGEPAPEVFPWYDVARACWEAEGSLFALEWWHGKLSIPEPLKQFSFPTKRIFYLFRHIILSAKITYSWK